MVKHIVMWQLKEEAEGNSKSENASLVKKKLHELKSIIKEINSLEVGENFNTSEAAFDVVLITTHQNREALKNYMVHPEHQKVAGFIRSVVEDRKVVDFEV